MATDCFCGCGQTMPFYYFGLRSVNTRGRQVVARLRRTEEIAGRDIDEPQIQAWFAQGDEIVAALVEAVHDGVEPRASEPDVRAWQADGREIERVYRRNMARMGKAIRKSGMTPEKAAEAIARGEFDPID